MIELYYVPEKVGKEEVEKAESSIKRYKNLSVRADSGFYEDVVVALGGDGTFLSALKKPGKYVLAIPKEGSLAFISDNTLDDLEECLQKIKKHSYEVNKIVQLQAFLNGKKVGNALNDVYIKATKKTVDYEIDFGHDRFRARGDGVIVFTPLGSTGYSHSVRGPKVDWDAEVMGISQIASCSFNDDLPYIIPNDRSVGIEIRRGVGDLYCDGEEPFPVKPGDVISVSVRPEYYSYLIRVNKEAVSEKILKKQIEAVERYKERT
ncbi:MAG: NAD(+)/NADH kinase [Candidatus Aenigmatarchaeota archaeon]